ncbi:hypothetical protein MAPG_07756 [Magnaporthiopsis poae ATCC 64411]|uniref:BZIP domain-containing protein n=1 Tax=Magnaporthiopsis poae (strain ATCC 64411 / 73-15) TaxID=644358 RepID=A0A0C4E5I7_MAGP6|nr:hypothetical protein MAPG_07756 [Magnaporthiopsis poae ATCC 64411]
MSSSQDPQDRKGKGVPTYSLEILEETADQAQSAHQHGTTEKSRGKRKSKSKKDQSGSDTETEAPKMSSRSSKTSSPSESTKKHGSSSRHRAPQNEDWTEVTDPEERRRIQNRIAQRKFRGKAKEQREKNERDQRNMEHAGDSYRVPEAGEMATDTGSSPGGEQLYYDNSTTSYYYDYDTSPRQ